MNVLIQSRSAKVSSVSARMEPVPTLTIVQTMPAAMVAVVVFGPKIVDLIVIAEALAPWPHA